MPAFAPVDRVPSEDALVAAGAVELLVVEAVAATVAPEGIAVLLTGDAEAAVEAEGSLFGYISTT